MTFLPIVERELRVAARRYGTYWKRAAVPLVALLVMAPQLLFFRGLGNPADTGRAVFVSLVVWAFIVCAASCLLTADALSRECREGTLGLLFLTRVRDADVVLGKLAVAGLDSLCLVVAFLPLLMIPVLEGGVTGGEVFRTGLTLLVLLLLALATGLCASARGSEWGRTARNAALMLCPLTAGPIFALARAGDLAYMASPTCYWLTLVAVLLVSVFLLLLTKRRLRRNLQEESDPEVPATFLPAGATSADASETPLAEPRSRRPLGDSVDPIEWRVGGQGGIRWALWTAATISLLNWVLSLLFTRLAGFGSRVMVGYGAYLSVSLAITLLSDALLAWVASRFFLEARHNGELEVLLGTPAGASGMVSAQWRALKRLLLGPVALMLLPIVLALPISLLTLPANIRTNDALSLFSVPLRAAIKILSVGAICWLGMWFGLTARRPAKAIAWTVGLGAGVPVLIRVVLTMLVNVFASLVRAPGLFPFALTSVSSLVEIAVYIGFIRWAKARLERALSGGNWSSPSLSAMVAGVARAATEAIRKAREWRPS